MHRTPPPKGRIINPPEVAEPYRDGLLLNPPGNSIPTTTYYRTTDNSYQLPQYQNQQLIQLQTTAPVQPPMYRQTGNNPQDNVQYHDQATTLSFIPYQQYVPQTQTEWRTVQNNKKRIRSPEMQQARKQTKLTNYWLSKPVETQNRYENLPNESEKTTDLGNNEEMEERVLKPPPITIYGAEYIAQLHEKIRKIASENYTLKVIGNGQVKIQLTDVSNFKPVIEMLDENKTQYHTYKPKEDRTFRVVMKGMHHSIQSEDITAELNKLGHEVTNVWNIRHRTTKTPLPMHYVDFATNENNKNIYKIKLIKQNTVSFEPPRAKRVIPQCTRCQSFGHTKNFCRRPEKCVKCAGSHHTKDCERRERDNRVKCVNCGGDHPANYRGCNIHKQLQQKLYPTLRKKQLTPQQNIMANQQPRPNMTPYQWPINYNQAFPILPSQAGRKYSQVLNNVIPPGPANQQTIQSFNNTNEQPTNDISELKSLIRELIEQNRENAKNMSTMLNLLTALVNKSNNVSTM